MPVRDWFAGGDRRLRKAVEVLAGVFAAGPPSGPAVERAARAYREAVELSLPRDARRAATIVSTYDARLPADRYPFTAADQGWLAGLLETDDPDVLGVVFTVASRVPLPDVRRNASGRLVRVVAPLGRADVLVGHLLRIRAAGHLDAATLGTAMTVHLDRARLETDEALWRGFLGDVPEDVRPDLFEVHRFLGNGADAARLAATPSQRVRAVELCAASQKRQDHEAGLRLATNLDRPDLLTILYEKVGNPREALRHCPPDRPERVADLAARCRPEIDALVAAGNLAGAAGLAGELLAHLAAATPETDAVRAARDDLAATRAAVLAEGRRHFAAALAATDDAAAVHREWSRFAESCGDPGEAAEHAELAGDIYRAHQLYRAAGRFGAADRVLRADSSEAGVAARAAARAAGGDPVGAARLHEQSGNPEDAAVLYARAGEPAAAARCLVVARGDDAVDDPRLADWLRRAGQLDELAERCLARVSAAGAGPAAEELRRLRHEPALPAETRARIAAVVDRLDGHRRSAFDGRVQAWVSQARFEVDARYAGIWALDLGTTTCSAAVFDTQTGRSVLCPWKGREQFASTVSFDKDGNEIIGLAGEELLASWVVGQIRASKRGMGSGRRYRFRERTYRPEQIAALFIAHGRRLVENFLAERVRERVGELARAELGEVRDEWLTDAERHNDLRLERPRALLTIPAYFLNNQKHATRDACRVAGVEVVRLIHEPTAACMSAARDRDLSGRVVVVDLGAGTLDVSLLEVGEGVYEVEQVLGDNHYGGRDFDDVIVGALRERLRRDGIEAPDSAKRRLEVAAEYLKISLSAQQEAEYLLRDLVGGRDVTLRLTRAELAGILKEPLETLRRTCATFVKELAGTPDHLVLVGGPMLSPLVQQTVESVVGLKRTVLRDPRTAVATGAALQAAVLDGKLREVVLLDVVPLALGVRVLDPERDLDEFSELIARNASIPTQQRRVYSTTRDNQDAVDIEIYNGSLDAAARVGQFRLGDLPPAKAGVPQIEVRFAIDASCVLEVTAQDLGSGNSRSIRVTDTTLLSPAEIRDMAERRERQTVLEELRREIADLIDDDAPAGAEATLRQFRIRLAGHRAAPPADPDARRELAAIVAEADTGDRELTEVVAVLRDLMVNARGFLRGSETAEALAQGRHLVRELRDGLDRLQSRLARVDRWSATLTRLAMTGPAPLDRFRQQHDTGDFAAALRTLAGVAEPLGPDDLRRKLRCLAEAGDADEYRATLAALGVTPPGDLRAHARALAVALTVTRSDGTQVHGTGFAVTDTLVATNRHWIVDGTVTVDGIPARRAALPDNPRVDLALLRAERPTGRPTPRLGHARLLHVGDRVAGPGGESVVDGFESFPDVGLRLIRTGLPASPEGSGGPVVNDAGEVVGVLAVGDSDTGGAFAITVDALTELINNR